MTNKLTVTVDSVKQNVKNDNFLHKLFHLDTKEVKIGSRTMKQESKKTYYMFLTESLDGGESFEIDLDDYITREEKYEFLDDETGEAITALLSYLDVK